MAAAYGYGAIRVPGVTLQPDVVIVGGGPEAIRGADADGLVWTIDRSAPGAAQLHVGSVMVMTSRATGRVAEIQDTGDARVVTLLPVALTDILRDGTISLDQAIDPAAMFGQSIPDLVGSVSDGSGTESSLVSLESATRRSTAVTIPAAYQVGATPSAPRPLPPATKAASSELSVGGWSLAPIADPTQLGVGMSYTQGLKAGLDVIFRIQDLRITGSVPVSAGRIGAFSMALHGVKGLKVKIAVGTARGAADNRKIRVELPFELALPLPPSAATAGLPLRLSIGFKLMATTALSGDNSTLSAEGDWDFDGALSMASGTVSAPTFTVRKSLTDSISGITLGPGGAVVAVKVKVGGAIGVPAAYAGPYSFITASVGVTNGSALGSPIARCHSATLEIAAGGGGELIMAPDMGEALSRLFPQFKLESNAEISKTILTRKQTVPDVPLCTGKS